MAKADLSLRMGSTYGPCLSLLVSIAMFSALCGAQDPPASAPASQPNPSSINRSNGTPTPIIVPYGPFAGQTASPVRRVTSGEQIVVFIDGKSKIVELAGVTLSGHDADRDAAKEFCESFLTGEVVIVRPVDSTRGRESAIVSAHVFRSPDGLLMNEELIRQGLAKVDEKYDGEYLERFLQFEARAKELKRGIWNPNRADKEKTKPAAIGPKTGPAQAAPNGEKKPPEQPASGFQVYITESGKKYHRATCQWAKTGKPIALEEARRMYEPCKVCKPPE